MIIVVFSVWLRLNYLHAVLPCQILFYSFTGKVFGSLSLTGGAVWFQIANGGTVLFAIANVRTVWFAIANAGTVWFAIASVSEFLVLFC